MKRDLRGLKDGVFLCPKIKVGVIGIGLGAGADFVSKALSYYLQPKERFVKKEEKYEIIPNPKEPETMDIIVGVIDPKPERVLSGIDIFKKLRKPGWEVIWLLNKDNTGVNIRELEWFLKLKPDFKQEFIPIEKRYASHYLKTPIYESTELKGIVELAEYIEKVWGSKEKFFENT